MQFLLVCKYYYKFVNNDVYDVEQICGKKWDKNGISEIWSLHSGENLSCVFLDYDTVEEPVTAIFRLPWWRQQVSPKVDNHT